MKAAFHPLRNWLSPFGLMVALLLITLLISMAPRLARADGFAVSRRTGRAPLKTALPHALTDLENHLPRSRIYGNYGAEDPSSGYAECFEYAELEKSYVCVFNSQLAMFNTFGRLADAQAGRVETDREHFLSKRRLSIEAIHVGPSPTQAICHAVQTDQRIRDIPLPNRTELYEALKASEIAFCEKFAARAAQQGYEIIALNREAPPNEVARYLTHELCHSQFMQNTAYREAILRFWKGMSADDRDMITNQLISEHYDFGKSEEHAINEFQAYLLQNGADQALLKDWVPQYREALMQALQSAQVAPIRLDDRP